MAERATTPGQDVILDAGPAHGRSIAAALRWAARFIIAIGAVFFALYPGGRLITALITLEGLGALTLIWLLLPIRYEVRRDAVRIVFRMGPGWRIHFADIEEIERPRRSRGERILIARHGKSLLGRRAISFSPAQSDQFAATASAALAAWRSSGSRG